MTKTLRELFVNRIRQSEIFGRMLEGQTRRRIMVITGGAGLGKSWLVRLFAIEATRRKLPLALLDFADGQAYDALTLVLRCRDAFGADHFPSVDRAIDDSTTARVALSTGAAAASTPVNINIGNENTLSSSTISVSDVGNTVVRDNSFYIQADNPILRQAIEDRINAAFFEDLSALSVQSRVVFLFDSYERNTLEAERWSPSAADRWIAGQVLARMRDGKLPNTVAVLAGRRTPKFGVEWNETLGSVTLDLLDCQYITEYLRERRGLANISDAQAEVLCQAVAGNPQVMGMIGDNLEQANKPKVEDEEW
ncbi:MAG TPA: hypothetical protein VFU22_21580 [Roseiflexaceae bacterium]|nr:hypothetical protein [Roseiflexaceae bacterium]